MKEQDFAYHPLNSFYLFKRIAQEFPNVKNILNDEKHSEGADAIICIDLITDGCHMSLAWRDARKIINKIIMKSIAKVPCTLSL